MRRNKRRWKRSSDENTGVWKTNEDKVNIKKKSLKKGRLQLWRRTTTQREWERSMWLENQKREVDKWLIDDKEGWVIKSKRNVKGLDNPYENTRKTNWNDVVIRYKTLWINKTQHLKSRKKKNYRKDDECKLSPMKRFLEANGRKNHGWRTNEL
jgi:hypothetical protein